MRKFELSCQHFDHNIVRIRLLTMYDLSRENQEILKGIKIQFSDGVEDKIVTDAGESNR